jgi:peptidoglycan hydrolase-like protein with peptidoglycan-binding domain
MPSSVTITQNLQVGASGQNVLALQTFLIAKGFLTMPAGTTTGYFGNLTKQALIAYQKSVGFPSTGYCGSMTRAKISSSQ